jgi:Amt family ammonium transporter
MTGLLANKSVSGVTGSVLVQTIDALAVLFYSGAMTAVLLMVTKFIVGLRVDNSSEQAGLDISQHRERITG